METSQIHKLSLLELNALLQRRELSSREIVDALIARRAAVEPKVNAFTEAFDERARQEAIEVDDKRAKKEPLGPLAGLPFTIKENIAIAGHDVTLGIRARRGRKAGDDAVVVKLIRRAGGIVLGKTNIPQTLLFHECDNPIWGRTNNPWDLERTPGGSSGGESAAVASGMSACGIGTDIGGSIRVPAAFTGVYGLKPTVDRWSNLGCTSALRGQEMIRAQCGPITRSARDIAFLMRTLDGPLHAALDPLVPPVMTLDPARTEVKLLRVGYFEDDRFFTPSTSVRRAVNKAVKTLVALGVPVEPVEIPSPIDTTYLYFAALASDGGKTLDGLLEGDPVVPQLKALRVLGKLPSLLRSSIAAFLASQGDARIERLLRVGHARSVAEYWPLAAQRAELRMAMLKTFEASRIDALICPAHPTPALRHGQSREFSLGGSYSMYWNLLNFPAGVVPVTRVEPGENNRTTGYDRLERVALDAERESEGLPIGVQVVAKPWREDVALALMIALEDALKKDPDYPQSPVDVA